MSSPSDEDKTSWRQRPAIVWPLVALVGLLCVLPTLPWAQFGPMGSEAVNVATALEMRRTGHWLMPTIQGQLRLNKPPLEAWITAAGISDRTLAQIGSSDRATRQSAQRRLAWEARWPSTLMMCLGLIGVYELGRAMGGGRAGIWSVVAGGTCLLFLRHARWAQTDSQLAVWVAVTNAFLARAVLKGQWWKGCIGGGIALGIGILAKGQMAPLMTVLPAGIYCIWRNVKVDWRAAGVGVLIALLLGGWWFVYVGGTVASGWAVFWREATRIGANELKADSLRNYWKGYPVLMLPWTPFLVVGLIVALRKRDAGLLAVLLVAVPLLVMSPFKERKERYLAPLYSAGAVLAGMGAMWIEERSEGRGQRSGKTAALGILVGALAVGGIAFNSWDALTSGRADLSVMRPFAQELWDQAPRAELYGYAPVDTQAAYLLVPGAEMAIYLDRPVHWVTNVAEIPRGANVALMIVNPDEKVMAETKAGWTVVRDETRRDVRRIVMVRAAD